MTSAQAGLVTFLAPQTALTGLLGSDDNGVPWIFQNFPQDLLEGSGDSAVVVYNEGQWISPNRHNSMEFPRIVVDVYSDATKDRDGMIAVRDPINKNLAIHAEIRLFLHNLKGGGMEWGDVRVMDSVAMGEPIRIPLDAASGELKMHRVAYAVTVG